MADATQTQKNRFVREVDLFMANYEKLKSPANQAIVYNSGNQQLIAEYENTINSSGRLRGRIELAVGAWNEAKRVYASTIDTTSMGIGDAIDEIRSWFGYDPSPGLAGQGLTGQGLQGLGVIQIIPAVMIAGFVTAAVLANAQMSKIFIMIKAAQLEKSGVSPERAAILARQSMAPALFGGMNKALIVGGVLALVLMLSKK